MVNICCFVFILLPQLYMVLARQPTKTKTAQIQPKQLLLRDELPWHDSWKTFMEETESSTDIKTSIRTALSSDTWWEKWEQLPSFTKDDVIKKLTPVLIGGEDWKIHCSDAYRLCLADSNCRIKYWNYVTSCTDDSSDVMPKVSLVKSRSVLQPLLAKTNSDGLQRTKRSARKHKLTRKKNKFLHKPSWYRKKKFKLRRKRRKMKLERHKTTQPLHSWMGNRYRNIFHTFPPPSECNHDCVSSLLMLNNSVYGALLARCDCNTKPSKATNNNTRSVSTIFINTIKQEQSKNTCVRQQLVAKTCRPRVFRTTARTIGCTEARLRCKNNPRCYRAQRSFLLKCSQVINGVTCTPACRKATKTLKRASKYFSKCRCDGTEGPACQKIRFNLSNLCEKQRTKSRKVINRNRLSNSFTQRLTLKSSSELFTGFTSKRTKRPLQYKVLNRGKF